METEKMKNSEIISHYNFLFGLQEKEDEYKEEERKQLFGGRVKVTYAINKNMDELLEKLKPYTKTIMELTKEYRDTEKEKEILTEMRKKIEGQEQKEARPTRIFKKGKSAEEYEEKIKELLEIEEEVKIRKIAPELLDGLDLSGGDLRGLMFMLQEE